MSDSPHAAFTSDNATASSAGVRTVEGSTGTTRPLTCPVPAAPDTPDSLRTRPLRGYHPAHPTRHPTPGSWASGFVRSCCRTHRPPATVNASPKGARPATPQHQREHNTMHNWTTILEAIGDLLNLAAAVITLIAIRSQRPGK
ncbi:hypothetical protein Ato02nite_086550 [Paractinoplanes toevensis]|uniref:Uncharacterized protein n=1 Tax=Paractinoplanes toevensis TaxID=571911 RepID=A0A919WAY0_9ACTN|nr:hypothetical protein Ato02nite_086550 [Actinoplanes toevensis]